jgi:hypothetical protein
MLCFSHPVLPSPLFYSYSVRVVLAKTPGRTSSQINLLVQSTKYRQYGPCVRRLQLVVGGANQPLGRFHPRRSLVVASLARLPNCSPGLRMGVGTKELLNLSPPTFCDCPFPRCRGTLLSCRSGKTQPAPFHC